MDKIETINSARMRLVEIGGRTSHDFGLGRIVGQLLVYLYLQPTACSLDKLEKDLFLSKASVSVAARQLEQLGLIQRVWLKGDRKKHYRSAENIAQALQQGLLSLVRQKVSVLGDQLQITKNLLGETGEETSQEGEFLRQRISRASKLQKRLDSLLGNPLVRLLTNATDGNIIISKHNRL